MRPGGGVACAHRVLPRAPRYRGGSPEPELQVSETTDRRVRVWFLVLGQAPVVIVDVAEGEDRDHLAGMMLFALKGGGLTEVPGFFDHQLEPVPPRVAWHLDDELTLADQQGERILRLPASSVDAAWRERALEVRGTATYVTAGLEADATAGPREVCDALDRRARAGEVVAAIVGVGASRPTLPLFAF